MTTPQDSTNITERTPRPSERPPDEPRRASGPERQNTMPPRRTWLWFALILLANSMSANHSHVLRGGMVFCLSGPDARRGSSGGRSEGRGVLSVVLVLSCGVVIGYLRRRAHALVHLRRYTQPPRN